MKTRTIKHIISAQKVAMGEHLLDQPLPLQGIDQIDPFLLIHHWKNTLKGNQKQQNIGVGPHPHRGFSPVTFVFKGAVHHRDSLGNDAVVGEGGTQWMHAGKGITHSERPSKELSEIGGENEFIQFWVNTPAKYKMEAPYYLPLSKKDTPELIENGVSLEIVAGTYKGIKGPAKVYSPQILLRGETNSNAKFTLNLPITFNVIVYLLDGALKINDKTVSGKDMVWMNNEAHTISIEAIESTRFIVLSGEPIGEKVSSYGPFVMNTQTQILEALRDSQMGKMGVLIEEF